MLWAILTKKEFIVTFVGLLAMIFGMLGMPGLQWFFSSPDVLTAIQTLVTSLGGIAAVGGTAAAVMADPPE